jgi:hypothetical protein
MAKECNHPKCRVTRKLQLPTRLLDVGVNGDTSGVKLVDTESLGTEGVAYTALSHCWGSDPASHCIATADNEPQHRANIALDTLPRTYRDAVIVTRKLDVRYIWIDSLAIIQHNRKDWEHESARMSDVYRGALLTLAATSAEDANGGLFLASLEPPMELHYCPDTPPALVRCPAADVDTLHVTPINARAWTLQELIMSPRTAHFAADQLYWQCHTLLLSEDGLVQNDKVESLRRTTILSPLNFSNQHIAREYWWKWVEDYAARKLTNSEDWLTAFAGITQYFADESGLTPCLGLWEETLVEELAWSVVHNFVDGGTPTPRTAVPGVPSWSWLRFQALIMGPRTIFMHNDRALIVQVDRTLAVAGLPGGKSGELHAVRWAGAPLALRIEAAQLALTGPVKRLAFRRRMRSQRTVWALERADASEVGRFVPVSTVSPVTREGTFEAVCLALLTYSYGKARDSKRGCFLVLRRVLRHLDDKYQNPIFQRLGVGWWDTTVGGKYPFAAAKSMTIMLR